MRDGTILNMMIVKLINVIFTMLLAVKIGIVPHLRM